MVERIRTLLESRQLTPTQFADVIGVARPIVSHILSGRNKPSLEVVQRILAALPDLAMPWLLNGTGPMLVATSAADIIAASSETIVAPVAAVSTAASVSSPVDEHRPTGAEVPAKVPQASTPTSQYPEQEPIMAAVPTLAPPRASASAPGRDRVALKRFVVSAAPLDALPQASAIMPLPIQPLEAGPVQPPVVVPVQDIGSGPSVPLPPPVVEVPAMAVPFPSGPAADATPGAAHASALFAGGDKPIRRIVIFYRDGSFADYQPE